MAAAEAPEVPATMKCFQYTPGGGMKLEASAPVPSVGPNQVLVKVHCAGLNPVRATRARCRRGAAP